MSAIPIQDFDLCSQRDFITKDTDRRAFLDNSATKRVFGLKAYYKNGVSGVIGAVRQVVYDSPRFCHARSGNDDEGRSQCVEGLRLLDFARISDELEAKQLIHTANQVFSGIEAVRVHLEH